MQIHDPDDDLPDKGTVFRHHKREKSEIIGVAADETDVTVTVPGYTIKLLDYQPVSTGGTQLEMHHRVRVIDTDDPEFLAEGDTFQETDEVLQSEIYTEIDA